MLSRLTELAEDASYAVSDLLDDDQLNRFHDLTDREKIRYRYLHADCDDFALALYRIFGWQIVSAVSEKGPLHRLNITPGGDLVDASGRTTVTAMARRYRARTITLSPPGGAELSMSVLDDDCDLLPVVNSLYHLHLDYLSAADSSRILGFAKRLQVTIDQSTLRDSPLLIVVHPGSMCGSANENIGRMAARHFRDSVSSDLRTWKGDLLVLDGDLSEELPNYPMFAESIDSAVRMAAGGELRLRLPADDPEHVEIGVDFVLPRYRFDNAIHITGAWHHFPEPHYGCVTALASALHGAGFTQVQVLDSAASTPECDVSEAAAAIPPAPASARQRMAG